MNLFKKENGGVIVDYTELEYWGGEYRPLEELIREMDKIKGVSQ